MELGPRKNTSKQDKFQNITPPLNLPIPHLEETKSANPTEEASNPVESPLINTKINPVPDTHFKINNKVEKECLSKPSLSRTSTFVPENSKNPIDGAIGYNKEHPITRHNTEEGIELETYHIFKQLVVELLNSLFGIDNLYTGKILNSSTNIEIKSGKLNKVVEKLLLDNNDFSEVSGIGISEFQFLVIKRLAESLKNEFYQKNYQNLEFFASRLTISSALKNLGETGSKLKLNNLENLSLLVSETLDPDNKEIIVTNQRTYKLVLSIVLVLQNYIFWVIGIARLKLDRNKLASPEAVSLGMLLDENLSQGFLNYSKADLKQQIHRQSVSENRASKSNTKNTVKEHQNVDSKLLLQNYETRTQSLLNISLTLIRQAIIRSQVRSLEQQIYKSNINTPYGVGKVIINNIENLEKHSRLLDSFKTLNSAKWPSLVIRRVMDNLTFLFMTAPNVDYVALVFMRFLGKKQFISQQTSTVGLRDSIIGLVNSISQTNLGQLISTTLTDCLDEISCELENFDLNAVDSDFAKINSLISDLQGTVRRISTFQQILFPNQLTSELKRDFLCDLAELLDPVSFSRDSYQGNLFNIINSKLISRDVIAFNFLLDLLRHQIPDRENGKITYSEFYNNFFNTQLIRKDFAGILDRVRVLNEQAISIKFEFAQEQTAKWEENIEVIQASFEEAIEKLIFTWEGFYSGNAESNLLNFFRLSSITQKPSQAIPTTRILSNYSSLADVIISYTNPPKR